MITARRFTDDHVAPALIFIALATLACITPAQNDTFWHLRSGQQMWQTGSLIFREPFSYTAYGNELHNHWWLSQLAFFAIYSLGGPFLLTLFAGACAFAAVAGSWRLMRGPWELRIGLLAWLVVATVPEWSVRPQVISLGLLVLMAHLISRDRLAWLPLVCVVWANAHAMVVFGVVMGGAVLLEAVLWSRAHVKRAATIAAACAVAPMVSPLGWSYWRQLFTTVSVSRELQIQEYQMPLDVADLPFWAGAVTLVAVAAVQRHRLRDYTRVDRILLIGAAVLALAAATAGRNVAFFAVVAAPVLTRFWPSGESARRRAASPAPAAAWALVLLTMIAGSAAVWVYWHQNRARLGWEPMSQAAIEAVRHCPDPVFNEMADGGFLMWMLPNRRVFVDSRMEAYPLELLRSSRRADVDGDYADLFRRYRIGCAVATTGSVLQRQLARDDSMTMLYSDPQRTVFRRSSLQERTARRGGSEDPPLRVAGTHRVSNVETDVIRNVETGVIRNVERT